MNKVTLTRKGLQFFHQENQEEIANLPILSGTIAGRSSSLPHLHISTNPPILLRSSASTLASKNQQLSKLTMHLKDIKQKGLRKIMLQKEDQCMRKTLNGEVAKRRSYLREIIPVLVRKTRDGNCGNLQSRLERGRAYVNRLEFNFENKFVFHPPRKDENIQ